MRGYVAHFAASFFFTLIMMLNFVFMLASGEDQAVIKNGGLMNFVQLHISSQHH